MYISVVSANATSATVNAYGLSWNTSHGATNHYMTWSYCPVGGLEWVSEREDVTNFPRGINHTFFGLQPNTNYRFKVEQTTGSDYYYLYGNFTTTSDPATLAITQSMESSMRVAFINYSAESYERYVKFMYRRTPTDAEPNPTYTILSDKITIPPDSTSVDVSLLITGLRSLTSYTVYAEVYKIENSLVTLLETYSATGYTKALSDENVPEPYLEYVKSVPSKGQCIIKYGIAPCERDFVWGTDIFLHIYESTDDQTFTDRATLTVLKPSGIPKRYYTISGQQFGTRYYKFVVLDANNAERFVGQSFEVKYEQLPYTARVSGDEVDLTASEVKSWAQAIINKAYYHVGSEISHMALLDDSDFDMTYQEAYDYCKSRITGNANNSVIEKTKLRNARRILLEGKLSEIVQGGEIIGAWLGKKWITPTQWYIDYIYETPWDYIFNLCFTLNSTPFVYYSTPDYSVAKSTTTGVSTSTYEHEAGDEFKASNVNTLHGEITTALNYAG